MLSQAPWLLRCLVKTARIDLRRSWSLERCRGRLRHIERMMGVEDVEVRASVGAELLVGRGEELLNVTKGLVRPGVRLIGGSVGLVVWLLRRFVWWPSDTM